MKTNKKSTDNNLTAIKKSIAVIAVASIPAAHADFQGEVQLGMAESETQGIELDSHSIGTALYLDTVDTENGPLAEAAFLSQSSSVYASAMRGSIDDNGQSLGDTKNRTVGVRYINDDGLLLGTRLSKADVELDNGFSTDTLRSGFSIGQYLSYNSLLELNYDRDNTEVDGASGSTDADTVGVRYKQVMDLGGDRYLAWNTGLSRTRFEDNTDMSSVSIGGDYYLTRNFSIGANVEFVDTEDEEEATRYDVSAKHFFTENIAADAQYSVTKDDSTDDDLDTFSVGLSMRF